MESAFRYIEHSDANEKQVKMCLDDQNRYQISSLDHILVSTGQKYTMLGIVTVYNGQKGVVSLSKVMIEALHLEKNDSIIIEKCLYPHLSLNQITLQCFLPVSISQNELITSITDIIRKKYTKIPLLNKEILNITLNPLEQTKFGLSEMFFQIIDAPEKHTLFIADHTNITIRFYSSEHQYHLSDIAGYDTVKEKLQEILVRSFDKQHIFTEYPYIHIPQCLIIYGVNGCGKTSLIRGLATDYNYLLITPSVADILDKHYGEGEKNIRMLFQQAKKNKEPVIIFFDDFTSIFGKIGMNSEIEDRLSAELLNQLKNLSPNIRVVIEIQDISELNSRFRNNMYFPYEIIIDPPNIEERVKILQHYANNKISNVLAKNIAYLTHGFNGSDLQILTFHAISHAATRNENIDLQKFDYEYALKQVPSSVMRSTNGQLPSVSMTDIIGLEEAKKSIEESVLWRIKPPSELNKIGKSDLTNGILLYGHPGCGKTMLGQAVAHDAGCSFFFIRGPEIISKYLGESMRTLRDIFAKAKRSQPSIIFIDEIDAITSHREEHADGGEKEAERLVTQFLAVLNGLEQSDNVIVIGATNRPDRIDPAVIRSDRFDVKIHIPLPNHLDRSKLFEKYLKNYKHTSNMNYDALASLTDKYSCADIHAIVKHARNKVVRELQEKKERASEITYDDILWIIQHVVLLSSNQEDFYHKFQTNSHLENTMYQ